MERKIPLWVLLLTCLIFINITVLFGWAVYNISNGGEKLRRFEVVILSIARFPDLVYHSFKELTAQTPLIVENRFPEYDGFKLNGVIQEGAVNDSGYLLLSAYDGNEKQSDIKLIRLHDQKVLHEWIPNVSDLARSHSYIADPPIVENELTKFRFEVGHPFPLEDGGVIFHNFEGPIYKIDACSRIVWVNNQHFHHSIERGPHGNFWVPTVVKSSSFSFDQPGQYRNDAIAKLSPDGTILFEKSVSAILEENGYRGLLYGTGPYEDDLTHLNEIQPATTTSPYWEKGDLLISLRNRSTVFIYRPSTDRIIWLKTGPWLNQHNPQFVGTSGISVFGNDAIRPIEGEYAFVYGQSNIYLYNFADNTVSTPYSGILKELSVSAATGGRQKILENGDAFVEDSGNQRLLRISPRKLIWAYMPKLDDRRVGVVSWSRYLNEAEANKVLPALERTQCRPGVYQAERTTGAY